MTTIETFTGLYVNLENPDPETITIEDIAHGLSNLCRYTGQCKSFYSVAEHTVMAADLLPSKYKKMFMLHDGAEAYFADINKPLKMLLPRYRRLEKKCQRVIYRKFIGKQPRREEQVVIKKADNAIYILEKHELFPLNHLPLSRLPTLPCWPPKIAERMFLQKWKAMHRE